MITKEEIEQFGKVECCRTFNDDAFRIEITDGFSQNAMNTFKLMGIITEKLPEYPTVYKMRTEDNSFLLILKK